MKKTKKISSGNSNAKHVVERGEQRQTTEAVVSTQPAAAAIGVRLEQLTGVLQDTIESILDATANRLADDNAAEVDMRLEPVELKLAALAAQVYDTQNSFQRLKHQCDERLDARRLSIDEIKLLRSELSQLMAKVDATSDHLGALESKTPVFSDELQAAATLTDSHVARLDSAETRCDETEQAVDGLRKTMESVEQRLAAAIDGVMCREAAIGELQTTLDRRASKMDTLVESVNSLATNVEILRSRLVAIENSTGTMPSWQRFRHFVTSLLR